MVENNPNISIPKDGSQHKVSEKDSKKKESPEGNEDELNLDFSKIKSKLSNFFKKSGPEKPGEERHHDSHEEHPHPSAEHHAHHSAGKEDEMSLDLAGVTNFAKKQAKWLIPVACILIAMMVSLYFRTMPLSMPITDDWAQNYIYSYYKDQISAQISQQYPNLPAQNRDALVEKEWQKQLSENKGQINNNIAQVSQQFKTQFKDDQGTLYLLGIDPWYWYQQTQYILQNGYPGNEIQEGKPYDTYRLAPIGTESGWTFHTWFGAVWHQLVNFFAKVPLMYTFFFIGAIFSALACIPAFFIGRRISGNNIGGFFTAFLIAVSSFFVQRTTGESSDTDVYVVFFPLLITWLFLEALSAKDIKKKLFWGLLAGISTGIFSYAWMGGWWYVFDFILITMIIYLVCLLARNYQKMKWTLKSPQFRHAIYLSVTYFISTWIITSLFYNMRMAYDGLMGPFGFMKLKAVAVTSLWPNILTTVAELNVVPISDVIQQLGGNLLFALAIGGIIMAFLKKDEQGNHDIKTPILLTIWFIASLYATTKGVRFILQATPVFALAFGAFLGISWHYLSKWISKELKIEKRITQAVVFILLCLLLIQPAIAGYDQAHNSVPSINDGWYNTLSKIKAEAPQKSIITSWWDFGYWFRAVADRPVTFDGGAQVGWGAHWVGKSLLTSDEKTTVGIIRMLNCGQNNAFDELDKLFNDTPKEMDLLNKVIVQDKEEAVKTLKNAGLTSEQIAKVIKNTHCDAPTDYYITSEDMVGKSGVWGHFGAWDFNRAEMFLNTKKLSREEGIAHLIKEHGLTPEQAEATYSEIQNPETEADKWISPWPGYVTGLYPCQKESISLLTCSLPIDKTTLSITVDLDSHNTTFKISAQETASPYSLVYATKETVEEKKFAGKTIPYSMILVPDEGEYKAMFADPLLATSTFTRLFFFEGHGMKCFTKFDEVKLFSGGKASTWTVDYDCKQNNKVFFLPKEEVRAAHLLISTLSWNTEEALKIIEDLKKNITSSNFAEYAKRYSDDPGSKESGGELGWFGKGVMIPEFEKTAFGLKVGEISAPIKTQYGYHLIFVEEKRTT